MFVFRVFRGWSALDSFLRVYEKAQVKTVMSGVFTARDFVHFSITYQRPKAPSKPVSVHFQNLILGRKKYAIPLFRFLFTAYNTIDASAPRFHAANTA